MTRSRSVIGTATSNGGVDGDAPDAMMCHHGGRSQDARLPRWLAKGFRLYMVKAVMNGRRGDEVIDLARSNLCR
jgi:hypothetical protein